MESRSCYRVLTRLPHVVVSQLQSSEVDELGAERQRDAALAVIVVRVAATDEGARRWVVPCGGERRPGDGFVVVSGAQPELAGGRYRQLGGDAVLPDFASQGKPELRRDHERGARAPARGEA